MAGYDRYNRSCLRSRRHRSAFPPRGDAHILSNRASESSFRWWQRGGAGLRNDLSGVAMFTSRSSTANHVTDREYCSPGLSTSSTRHLYFCMYDLIVSYLKQVVEGRKRHLPTLARPAARAWEEPSVARPWREQKVENHAFDLSFSLVSTVVVAIKVLLCILLFYRFVVTVMLLLCTITTGPSPCVRTSRSVR